MLRKERRENETVVGSSKMGSSGGMKYAVISGNEQGRVIERKDSVRGSLSEVCEKRPEAGYVQGKALCGTVGSVYGNDECAKQ
jgi:hypothetical protein